MSLAYVERRSPHFLIRAIWFVLAGLWLSGLWAVIGWVLCLTIIGLPLGVWMLNRIPLVATLYAPPRDVVIGGDGRLRALGGRTPPFLVRALWFVLVGWWVSALWMSLAWALCATWIGMPFGAFMLNRVPFLLTLGEP